MSITAVLETPPKTLDRHGKLPPSQPGDTTAVATAEEDICTKCNQYVHPANDARLLAQKIHELFGRVLPFKRSCHLLVVTHSIPEKRCEGVPWLAQYLPGQPRAGPYDQQFEDCVREAYQALQDIHGPAEG